MPAGVRSHGRRQVAIEIGVARSGYVGLKERLPPSLRVLKIEPAVDDGQPRIAQKFPQRVHADECRKLHEFKE